MNISLLGHISVLTMLTAASIIDVRERRIPDKLVLAGALTGVALSILNTEERLTDSIIGGAAAGLIMLSVYFLARGALGFGDVKLIACTGIYLSLEGTASVMLIAAVLSGMYSLVLMGINRDNKNREIPFAPFVLAGALATILF